MHKVRLPWKRPALFLTVGAIAALSALPQPLRACAVAVRADQNVSIVHEEAVIVWNPATKTEHFIRQAAFDTNAQDLGFLVPTPTVPQLTAAKADSFSSLDTAMAPKVETRILTGIKLKSAWLGSKGAMQATSGARPTTKPGVVKAMQAVEILQTGHVAGYDAVVLTADNANALADWLKKNGYADRAALGEWLAPYVASHWKVTAFKFTKNNVNSAEVSSSVVRMSFHTDKPFFPYREPADQRKPNARYPPRLLRVFFLSDSRMEGTLGSFQSAVSPPAWPGHAIYADQIDNRLRDSLTAQLALTPQQLPAALWLTTFLDPSSPRPGTDDLYFAASPTQDRLVLPPIIHTIDNRTTIPAETFIGTLILIAALITRLAWPKKRHSFTNSGNREAS